MIGQYNCYSQNIRPLSWKHEYIFSPHSSIRSHLWCPKKGFCRLSHSPNYKSERTHSTDIRIYCGSFIFFVSPRMIRYTTTEVFQVSEIPVHSLSGIYIFPFLSLRKVFISSYSQWHVQASKIKRKTSEWRRYKNKQGGGGGGVPLGL